MMRRSADRRIIHIPYSHDIPYSHAGARSDSRL